MRRTSCTVLRTPHVDMDDRILHYDLVLIKTPPANPQSPESVAVTIRPTAALRAEKPVCECSWRREHRDEAACIILRSARCPCASRGCSPQVACSLIRVSRQVFGKRCLVATHAALFASMPNAASVAFSCTTASALRTTLLDACTSARAQSLLTGCNRFVVLTLLQA